MAPRPLLRRRLRDLFDGDAASVAGRVRPGDGLRPEIAEVLRERVARDPGVAELRLAEQVLEDPEVVAELREAVRAARPELLYPLLPRFGPLREKHRPTAMRELLDEALATTDATGVDVDVVIELAHRVPGRTAYRRMIDWVAEHAAEAEHPPGAVAPRFGVLVGVLDTDDPNWRPRLEAWLTEPGDALVAFQAATSLKHRPALAHLVQDVDLDDLSESQLARAAQQLARWGTIDLALPLARRVGPGSTAAAERAAAVVAEHDSLALMDEGWRPDPPEPPAYESQRDRVLHVLQNALPHRVTGSANRSHGLLDGIARHGYDVVAITPPGFPHDDVEPGAEVPPSQRIDRVEYRLVPHDGPGVLPRFPVQRYIDRYAAAIVEQARLERSALVHTASNGYNGLAGMVAAHALGLPTIYEVRGLYEETRRSQDPAYGSTRTYAFARHVETLAAQEADHVIAITAGLRTTLLERGVPEEKITLVPNGVDTERFRPLERDEDLARSYGLGDAVVIGYVGSLNWYEGHDLLFEAFARVHARHPEVRLLLVGDGPMMKELQRLRSRLGLEEAVVMPGRIPFDRAEAHYSIIDVAPITRRSSPVTETVSPLKPFEAMAMARTLVSCDVAVMTEVVVDDDNGLLFAKDDVDSLEQVLERLAVDPDLRARLAARAREWVVAERDWTTLAGRVDGVYRSLGLVPRAAGTTGPRT